MTPIFRRAGAAVVALMLTAPAYAPMVQRRPDLDVVQRIRDGGLSRGPIEPIAKPLLDVIGPGLTRSAPPAPASTSNR